MLSDPPQPPSAPVITEPRKDSCQLTWTAPENDGGSPITGYYVERSTAKSSRWLRITKELVSDLTYSAKELMEDTEYEFRVVAVNKIGESEPSPKSQTVLAKDPWGMFF